MGRPFTTTAAVRRFVVNYIGSENLRENAVINPIVIVLSFIVLSHQCRVLNRRNRLALVTTVIEDSAIAAPATTGLSRNPNAG